VVGATLDQRTSRDPHQGGCKRRVVGHRTHVVKIPSPSCALRIPREKEYGQISVDRKIQIIIKKTSLRRVGLQLTLGIRSAALRGIHVGLRTGTA
jgi:hypothetical protein